MASGFDPYHKWLGIPPEDQPPNHYRLLGLRQFESDPEVIEAASDQRMAHLRTYQAGQYSALSQKLLNEVAGAKICLLSPEKRAQYDESLRAGVSAAPPAAPLSPSSPISPDMPVASIAPLPASINPPPLQESPVEPIAPPAAGNQVFDLERLGVSEDLSGGAADRTSSAIGRRNVGSDQRAEIPVPAAPRVHKLLIAALAACAILLMLITTVVYMARGKRTFDALSEGRASSADPVPAVEAADPLTAQSREADEDLQALQNRARELSSAGPLSPLRGTRLAQSLWLHMNFQRETLAEADGRMFVKDLSGLNHHGVCHQGRLVPGRTGDALQCETPVRLLAAAVNQTPQFTLLAWVRCPPNMGTRLPAAAWWFDEDLAGRSLFGVGSGNCFQLRALSKSKQKTCAPISLAKLAVPPEQWNFIAVRSDVRDGSTYMTCQVNDQQVMFNNPDLFPVQAADGKIRDSFACTPKIQLAELMIFHAAIGDADIQALRSKAKPWSIPAGMGQVAAKPPVLLDPANGATLPNPDPPLGIVLHWQPVANASRYWARVEVPKDPKPLVDKQDLEIASLHMRLRRPIPRENCHGWRWQVRALVNGQWTDWSETRTFDLAEPAAQGPTSDGNGQVQPQPVEVEKPPASESPFGPASPPGPENPVVSADPVKAQKPIVRQPLPTEAARKRASQVYREVYKKQYDAAKTAAERLALADDMLHKAEESGDDPAAQYALLDRARALSGNAGDTDKALEIAEQMGRRFQIDVLPIKVETVTDGMQPGVPPPRNRDIGENVLAVMEELGRAKQYETAVQLGSLYRDRPHRTANAALVRRVVAQIKAMRDAQQEAAKAGEPRK